MTKKIIGFLVGAMFVLQTAFAGPVMVEIKPKEISKDPILKEYAAALWEGFKDDPEFIPVVNSEGLPRILLQIDAVTIPYESSSEKERFAYGVVMAVDLQGDDMPVLLTQTVNIGNKKEMKKIGKEQAEQIKDALRKMKGVMGILQRYSE